MDQTTCNKSYFCSTDQRITINKMNHLSHLLAWINLKKDVFELWILNGTVAAISLSEFQTLMSIGLIVLTGAYTIYKWRKDIKNKK